MNKWIVSLTAAKKCLKVIPIVLRSPFVSVLTSVLSRFQDCAGVILYAAENATQVALDAIQILGKSYKQLLDEVFVISRVIKVEVWVISRSRELRLISLAKALIILDIIKTESINCFIIHWTKVLLLHWQQPTKAQALWSKVSPADSLEYNFVDLVLVFDCRLCLKDNFVRMQSYSLAWSCTEIVCAKRTMRQLDHFWMSLTGHAASGGAWRYI